MTFEDCWAGGSCHYQCWQETYRGLIDDNYLDRLDEIKNQKRFEKIFEMLGQYQYVVEVDGQVVVFFDISFSRETYTAFEVQSLYLRKAYHGKGYGRQIIAFFREYCGNDHFYLWCLQNNPSTVFYFHMGGKIIDARTIYIKNQKLDEVCYLF